MQIKRIYKGLPPHLVEKTFWPAREYRTNQLSHIPGGADVVIEYQNDTVYGYDWVKRPDRYVKAILSKMYFIKNDFELGDTLSLLRENVKRVYARCYFDDNSYKDEPFKEAWNFETSSNLPWQELEKYKPKKQVVTPSIQSKPKFDNMNIDLNPVINNASNEIFKRFENRFQEILENCESPTKKLLFTLISNRITERKDFHANLKLLVEYLPIILSTDNTGEKELISQNLRLKNFDFTHKNGFTYEIFRYSGIEVGQSYGASVFIDGIKTPEQIRTGTGWRFLKIIPKFIYVSNDLTIKHFIDIAVLSVIRYDKLEKEIVESKIAIECNDDSSLHQEANSNARSRKMMEEGWKILNYERDEIDSLDEYGFDYILNQIIEITIP